MIDLKLITHMGIAGGMVGGVLFGLSTILPARQQAKLARWLDFPFKISAFAVATFIVAIGDFLPTP